MLKYESVADDIREKIVGGTYAPNDQLPTTPELCDEYQVSKITVKKAMDELVAQGLIARRRGVIAFVEVKLRKNANFAEAREFVTCGKQRRILKSASLWLAAHGCDELQPRFDVIEIYAPEGMETDKLTIHHLEDAFE